MFVIVRESVKKNNIRYGEKFVFDTPPRLSTFIAILWKIYRKFHLMTFCYPLPQLGKLPREAGGGTRQVGTIIITGIMYLYLTFNFISEWQCW